MRRGIYLYIRDDFGIENILREMIISRMFRHVCYCIWDVTQFRVIFKNRLRISEDMNKGFIFLPSQSAGIRGETWIQERESCNSVFSLHFQMISIFFFKMFRLSAFHLNWNPGSESSLP